MEIFLKHPHTSLQKYWSNQFLNEALPGLSTFPLNICAYLPNVQIFRRTLEVISPENLLGIPAGIRPRLSPRISTGIHSKISQRSPPTEIFRSSFRNSTQVTGFPSGDFFSRIFFRKPYGYFRQKFLRGFCPETPPENAFRISTRNFSVDFLQQFLREFPPEIAPEISSKNSFGIYSRNSFS